MSSKVSKTRVIGCVYILLFLFVNNILAQDVKNAGNTNTPKEHLHHTIAILPFKNNSIPYAKIREQDTSMKELMEIEATLGIETQEALYNSLMRNSDKLLTQIQDWKVTDSLLRIARVDFRKLEQLDLAALAKWLGVDAVLVGELRAVSVNGKENLIKTRKLLTHPHTIGLGKNAVNGWDKRKVFFASLYDGKSGELVWSFDDEMRVSFPWGDKYMDEKLMKSFMKRFPYID